MSLAVFYWGVAMSKSPKNRNKTKTNEMMDLKTHSIASHNQGSSDARIIALVKFLARHAAEEDYRQHIADHHSDRSGK